MLFFYVLACGGSTQWLNVTERQEVKRYDQFNVNFLGDYETWTDLVCHCDSAIEGEDSVGKSAFSVSPDGVARASVSVYQDDACVYPRFNVSGSGGFNTDPDVLGVPGEVLYLLVYDAWGEELYPRTIDPDKDFFEGGAMDTFDPTVGWLYLPKED